MEIIQGTQFRFNIKQRMICYTPTERKAITKKVLQECKVSQTTVKRVVNMRAMDNKWVNYAVVQAFAQAFGVTTAELDNTIQAHS